jgi:hypothetical protein
MPRLALLALGLLAAGAARAAPAATPAPAAEACVFPSGAGIDTKDMPVRFWAEAAKPLPAKFGESEEEAAAAVPVVAEFGAAAVEAARAALKAAPVEGLTLGAAKAKDATDLPNRNDFWCAAETADCATSLSHSLREALTFFYVFLFLAPSFSLLAPLDLDRSPAAAPCAPSPPRREFTTDAPLAPGLSATARVYGMGASANASDGSYSKGWGLRLAVTDPALLENLPKNVSKIAVFSCGAKEVEYLIFGIVGEKFPNATSVAKTFGKALAGDAAAVEALVRAADLASRSVPATQPVTVSEAPVSAKGGEADTSVARASLVVGGGGDPTATLTLEAVPGAGADFAQLERVAQALVAGARATPSLVDGGAAAPGPAAEAAAEVVGEAADKAADMAADMAAGAVGAVVSAARVPAVGALGALAALAALALAA